MIIDALSPPWNLMYGSGLRANEVITLRVKDIDFESHRLVVENGKGGKDRVTLLPKVLAELLDHQIKSVFQPYKLRYADRSKRHYLHKNHLLIRHY